MNLPSRHFAPRYFAPRYFGTRPAEESVASPQPGVAVSRSPISSLRAVRRRRRDEEDDVLVLLLL